MLVEQPALAISWAVVGIASKRAGGMAEGASMWFSGA